MNAKLTKGLAAAAISAAMMLGAAAPALAAETTAKPIGDNDTEVPVKVTYSETGNGDAPEETISYTRDDMSFTGNAHYTKDNMPPVNIKPVSVDADGTETAKEGNLRVEVPKYEAVGVYTYHFSRTTTINDAGVKDDVPGNLTVVVTVTNQLGEDGNPNGNFDRYVNIYTGADEKAPKVSDDGFKLSYAAGELTVTKNVTGNLGDQSTNNKFTFRVTLTGPDGKDINGKYHYTVAGGAQKEVTFNNGTKTVTEELAHGQSIVFQDLPAGVTYVADELSAQGNVVNVEEKTGDYTLKSKTYGDNDKLINGTEGENDTITFVNDYTKQKIDTGVLLNNAPYIAIIGGAAVVAIYVVNKRRHSDMD